MNHFVLGKEKSHHAIQFPCEGMLGFEKIGMVGHENDVDTHDPVLVRYCCCGITHLSRIPRVNKNQKGTGGVSCRDHFNHVPH